jgi:hypothetical protein
MLGCRIFNTFFIFVSTLLVLRIIILTQFDTFSTLPYAVIQQYIDINVNFVYFTIYNQQATMLCKSLKTVAP